MTLFLCNWYKREELAVRISFLFSKLCPEICMKDMCDRNFLTIFAVASALSGAFGGLLAWAMLSMNGVANMPGWRWFVPSAPSKGKS